MRLRQLLARAIRAPALPVALGSALYLAMLGPWFFTSRSVADVGIIVGSAARMLQGQVPYRDFFLFIGPLGPFLTAVWFLVFGQGALSMIGLTVLLGVACALATYALGRRLGGLAGACAAACAFLFVGPLYWFTISHHWFATLFLLLATLSAARASLALRPPWMFVAGVCCALAGLSHQPRGALGVVALVGCAFLWPRSRARAVLSAIAGAVAGVALPLALLATSVGPFDLGYDLLGFIVTQYPHANRVPYMAFDLIPGGYLAFPDLAALQAVLAWGVLAVGPLGLLALAWWALARRRSQPARSTTAGVVVIFGVAAWLGVVYQPSAVHLGYVSPWFLVAWMTLLADAAVAKRRAARVNGRLAIAALLTVGVGYLPIIPVLAVARDGLVWSASPSGPVPLGTPADSERYSGSFAEVSAFVMKYTDPSDPIAFFPYRSVNNVLLKRPNPLRLDLIASGENTDEQVVQALLDLTLRRRARYVFVETAVADTMAARGESLGTLAGRLALDGLRADLPLVAATPWLEVRDGRPSCRRVARGSILPRCGRAGAIKPP